MSSHCRAAIGLCLLALCLGAGDAEAAFGFRKLLTIDNTRVSGASDLVNFPVLVRLPNDADLQVNVLSAQGFDIQFRASDGRTILDHEIEGYDSGTGTLVAWVRVPLLDYNDDTLIYIYYGDPGITCALENPVGVWDVAYKSVYHLSASFVDSTSNGHDLAGVGTTDVPGRMASAKDFDGIGDEAVGDTTTLDPGTKDFTVEAWIKTSGPVWRSVAAKQDSSGEEGWNLWIDSDTTAGGIELDVGDPTTRGKVTSNVSVADGLWHHVAIAKVGLDRTNWRVYVDGASVAFTEGGADLPTNNVSSTTSFELGDRAFGADFFDGTIEEFRFSTTARSADWIATQFNNHNNPNKGAGCVTLPNGFLCAGAEEILPAAQWTDVSVASGLNTPTGGKDGGLSWGDFDDDGCLDVLVNGSSLARSDLYRQDTVASVCAGTFTDVTACLAPGLDATIVQRSALWADFNNDGYLDFARNHSSLLEVYLNNGPGVSGCGPNWSVFGVAGSPNVSFNPGNVEGIGVIDYDNDGDLDLVTEDDDFASFQIHANDGSGIFTNPETFGFAPDGTGDYLAVADVDVDGDVDVLGRSDITVIDLWANIGGTFVAGTFNEDNDGTNKGGVAFCDLDDDGDFDLVWTDHGTNQVWRNNGGTDAAVTWTAMGALPTAGDIDGVACGDVDNDGDLDLMMTSNGNDHLLRNDGAFAFVDISPASFGGNNGEGTAFADYDRDGDVDLLINQAPADNELWRNETNDNNYLVVRALQDVGGGITRDAIGATVQLMDCSLNPVIGVREINGGRGHGSQDPAYLHLGLPTCGTVHGPNSVYVVQASFLDGSVVQKAVRPSNISGYQLYNITSTDADDLLICSTAVDLVSFEADARDGAVELTWETGSEINNLGFNLYRSRAVDGPYELITSRPIPGLGSSPQGARYSYTDNEVTNETTYYYKLEDIETTGATEMHGPVSAAPQAGATGGEGGEGSSEEDTESLVTVGDPEANGLRFLESRTGELVLELTTGGFYATPLDDGTVHLEVPGYDLTADAGYPSLPVRRSWVEILAGLNVELVSVTTLDEETFDGFRPAATGLPFIEASREGTVRLRRADRTRRSRLNDTSASSMSLTSLYPEEAARILSIGFQEDIKKALVEMAPLRWDPSTERLTLAHRLLVRLRFEGRDFADTLRSGGRRSRRYVPPESHVERHLIARFVTTEPGLTGVAYEELYGSRGRKALLLDSLRLSRQGETIPFYVDGTAFGPGTTLYFVSIGARANPYGHEAVYELETGVTGEVMPTASASPNGEPAGFCWETLSQEQNISYHPTLTQAPDRWLWSGLFAPVEMSYTLEVSALAVTAESSQLKVFLQGSTDFGANPDHHVRLYMNDTFVGEGSWNGKKPYQIVADVGAGILQDGENTLTIENVGDTQAQYSMVMLNRFELTYPRRLEAVDGRWEGAFRRSGTADVVDISSQALVLESGNTGRSWTWLTGLEPSASGIRFHAEAARHYMAVGIDALLRVSDIQRPRKARLKTTRHVADLVMVGPRAFLPAAGPLIDYRRGQGLKVKAVAIEDVFSEFGFGEKPPQAIKDFLAYAYHNWQEAPRYVLLLGDATYDFKNELGSDSLNQVPPLMVMTSFLETVSDPAYGAVNGEDLLPDLAIGRLPAASVGELQTMVQKILDWETGGSSFLGKAVLVADNPDQAGNFMADAETLASTVLAGQELVKIYLGQLGTAATKNQIQQSFNDGSSLVNYIGHGGIQLWADENILNTADVVDLSLQSQQPILLTMNCLNGYFHFPYFNSMAEELLKAEGKGVVAAFSPSGLSLNYAAHQFHQALLDELLNGGHARLGDAVLAAQARYADWGALPEMLAIYHLFGDPTLELQ